MITRPSSSSAKIDKHLRYIDKALAAAGDSLVSNRLAAIVGPRVATTPWSEAPEELQLARYKPRKHDFITTSKREKKENTLDPQKPLDSQDAPTAPLLAENF